MSASSVKIGEIVEGRYRIVRPIDEGGMSTVYLAEHALIKRRVALKLLRSDVLGDNDAIDRFMNEASAAGTLGHPNIVESTDMGFTRDGVPFIVFEYLEGTLLTEEIYRVGGMTLRRALAIATQIASALEAAHDAGIIHRDLKTDNVFLTVRDGYSDHVKVLDFGVSRFSEAEQDSSRQLRIIGTPEFLAPEQILSPDKLDQRVDIYALGLVLYEMLAARRAFANTGDTDALLHRIVHEPPPPLSTNLAPRDVQELIFDQLLAKAPADRLGSMAEVQRALGKLMGTSRPSGSIPPFRRTPLPHAAVEPPPTSKTLTNLAPPPARTLDNIVPVERRAEGTTPPRTVTDEVTAAAPAQVAAAAPAPSASAESLAPASLVALAPLPAPRRRTWLAVLLLALLAGGAGTALLFVGPATTIVGAPPSTESHALAAQQIATALEQGISALRMRAESVASSPVLRAAVETDAATLQDMARDSDFVFTPRPHETLEVFQKRGAKDVSLLRIPAEAKAIAPTAGPTLAVVEQRVMGVVTVPITTRDGVMPGQLVLAAPVDVARVTGLDKVTSARLEGLGDALPIASRPATGEQEELRVPVAVRDEALRARPLSLVLSVDKPQVVTQDRYVQVRYAAWGTGGLLLLISLVLLLRWRARG